jgi:hypothetical protein
MVATLTVGPLVVLALSLIPRGERPTTAALPVISVVAILATATTLPLAFVLPGIMTEAALKKLAARPGSPETDADALARLYQTRTILGSALTEGVAFLAAMAYFLERTPYALGLALALVAATAARFPRPGTVARWVETQSDKVESLRHSMS